MRGTLQSSCILMLERPFLCPDISEPGTLGYSVTGKLSKLLPACHCAAGSWDCVQLAEDTLTLFPPNPPLLTEQGFGGG